MALIFLCSIYNPPPPASTGIVWKPYQFELEEPFPATRQNRFFERGVGVIARLLRRPQKGKY